jgi:hypothetical protein
MPAHDDAVHQLLRIDRDDATRLHGVTSRRAFLRLVGVGGAVAALPNLVAACDSASTTAPTDGAPASGSPLLIDFAAGDPAFLQFAYVLEQIEAEFYTRVVAAFSGSNVTLAEQAVLTDIRDHEIAHREFLEAALGASGALTAIPTFGGIDFADRATVLAAAKAFEDLGVAAYNGLAQYLTTPANLLAVAKIVSVEARHAATIRDLLSPSTIEFSPNATDEVYRPAKIAAVLQTNLVDKLGFLNSPATFVQGPREGG